MTIKEARKRVTFEVLWEVLELQGEPKVSLCSPIREDSKASFSIFVGRDGLERFMDFGTGETGDTFDFFKLFSGIEDNQIAYEEFIRLAEGKEVCIKKPTNTQPRRQQGPKEWDSFRGELHQPTEAQIAKIKETRGDEVTIEGLHQAVSKGFLKVGNLYGQECFVLTDQTLRNGDCRPLDGGKFPLAIKTRSLPGATRHWPVGTMEMVEGDFPFVMLVEGSGDALAAHSIIHAEGREDVAVVAMLGAAIYIPETCREHFKGRTVCIYPDQDSAGFRALKIWSRDLEPVAARVMVFDLSSFKKANGTPVKDLGELYASINQSAAGQAVPLLPQ